MSGAVNDASRSSPAKVLALEESRVLVEGSVREAEWILAKTRIAKEKFDSMGIMKSRNVHGWEKSGKGNGAGQAGPGNEGMQKKKEQEKHEKHVDHDVAEECSRAMRLVDDVKRQQDVMQKLLDGQTE